MHEIMWKHTQIHLHNACSGAHTHMHTATVLIFIHSHTHFYECNNGLYTFVCSLASCFSSRLVCLYTLVLYRNWSRGRKRERERRVNPPQKAFVLNSLSFWPRSTKWGLQIYCTEKLYLVCYTKLLFYFTDDKKCERTGLALQQFKDGSEPPLGCNIAWKEGDYTHWIRD